MSAKRMKSVAALLLCSSLTAPALLSSTPACALPGDWAPGAIVTTCSAPSDTEPVVGIEDLRSPSTTGGTPGNAWNWSGPTPPGFSAGKFAPMAHVWTRGELGQVFGVALDRQSTPDIFVASTDIYGGVPGPNYTTYPDGRYAIYRLRPAGGLANGKYELFFKVQTTGQASLGQIAFNSDALNGGVQGVLYASNFDDGKIYVVKNSATNSGGGALLTTYDHGLSRSTVVDPATGALFVQIADDTTQARSKDGRLVWAVQFNRAEGRLYYAVRDGDHKNSIWSVGVDASGAPNMPSLRREFEVISDEGNDNSSTKLMVSDIAFTFSGTLMMIAERYDRNFSSQVHQTRVLHFKKSGSSWVPEQADNRQRVGAHGQNGATNANSAGGIDYSYEYNLGTSAASSAIDVTKPEGRIVVSGDALTLGVASANLVYGVESTALDKRFTNYSAGDHYYADFNGSAISNEYDKTEIGDVEAWREPYTEVSTGAGEAIVKVCKVAGEGVAPNANFTFSDGLNSVQVPAGPAPDGYCAVLGSNYAVGANVTVQETAPAGYGPGSAADMTVVPATALVPGSKNVAGRKLTVKTVAGVTEVTFKNERKTGYLEICKKVVGEPISGNFSFTVSPAGPDGAGPFAVPAGACTPAIAVMAGIVTITEAPKAGTGMMNACSTIPSGRQGACDPTARTSKVTVVPGDIASQTIAYVTNRRTGGLPSGAGGSGPAESTGVAAPAEISFPVPADAGAPAATLIGAPPGAIALDCAKDAAEDSGLTLCTARIAPDPRSAAKRKGMVKFIADGRVIAILPLRDDGAAVLALPATTGASSIVAAFDRDNSVRDAVSAPVALAKDRPEAPDAPPAERTEVRLYRPGEPSPSDNEAAALNAREHERMKEGRR